MRPTMLLLSRFGWSDRCITEPHTLSATACCVVSAASRSFRRRPNLIRIVHSARDHPVSVFADAGHSLQRGPSAAVLQSEEEQLNQDGPGSADDGDQRGESRQLCSTDVHESAHRARKDVPRGTGRKPEKSGDPS
jgi:hypothetical protein